MRRLVLAAMLGVAALAAGPALAQQKVVNVYNWSDYIDESVLEDFTKETGIKVRYDVFDSNEVLETKLLAGKTGYDVVVPSGSFLQRQIKAGVFMKLDKSKLPNLQYAWPEISKRLAVYDPGNDYAVNYMWGTTGIGYNVDMVKQRLGDLPMNTWDIVFKPENLSKLKDCGVYMLDGPEEVIPSAMRYLGIDPDSKKPEDIAKAGELLMTIRPFIRKFDSSGYINALARGDICLAVGWSGDVFQAKTRAEEAAKKTKKKPVQVAYAVPKEGALMWFDNFAIPKDAKNVDEALAFINFMSRPEVAAKNSNYISYANGNLESQKFIDKAILDNPSIYPTPEAMALLFTVTTNPQDVQRVITRTWNSFKRGK
ncbi:putrescine-binding periplasmic protein [Azorhizobium oxalatiphilum]|uniref:Putrescine-binding periplasmic protein n=1 Tax=Azorhizobium oxalatiphilum TaxID=980631 RepID=A0A917FJ49_9HYPH|nr:polyamine ABC transporter substrate-binding protein [Azorhizobium oxalatiphilum]GGF82678.1 putrescine-binding periplasmic protein [Azorhizobium oxalatiphilum]